MLTYELKKAPGTPLYEALYRCIREDILSGALPAGKRIKHPTFEACRPERRAVGAVLCPGD